ncbi:DNA methyltransferase, partial [Chromatium okenii]
DGQDLAQWLANCFEVLNTLKNKRLTRLDEQLAAFPYINGHLFTERLPIAAFDREMRDLLLESCALDWGKISPAIFGALFQSVMNATERRQLGAHYTSETNILKLIQPLFLDDLRAEFERVKYNKKKLFAFQEKLAKLKFLDPACGCGNFLVIAYRELRLLELDVLRELFNDSRDLSIGVGEFNILCNVNQFYGIEIEEFPAQIAQTAMWLIDHQMNLLISQQFGQYYLRIPLTHSAIICHGNALQIDWRDVIKPTELNFILGNPPFIGKSYQSTAQKKDLARIFHDVKGAGNLDFVAAWFRKATDYMTDHPAIKTAFVSTSSIIQGEQIGLLWSDLLKRGIKVHFAHRTFQWSNEAKGNATVHCVIVGFALHDTTEKRLFYYKSVHSEPHETIVGRINPYLVDAPDVIVVRRSSPICSAPNLVYGSKPVDGGNFLFSKTERDSFLSKEPAAANFIKQFIGSEEFIYNIERYCLWLIDCPPEQLKKMPLALKRINKVRLMRLDSQKESTRESADNPAIFTELRQPSSDYLVIPEVSGDRRKYIPMGIVSSNVIASNLLYVIPNSNAYHFGILSSAMHMAWMRTVCGRLGSSYRYSAGIVYNNFPWPESITDKQRNKIELMAQAILDARAQSPNSSLAALYDPLTMPAELVKAHRQLDAAVDTAYSKQKFIGDTDRVAFLFERYQQLTA